MVHRLFLVLLLLSLTIENGIAQEKALNPVQNASLSNSILFQPQEFIEDERNVSGLFLTAPVSTPVIAPINGTISNFRINYLYSLTNSRGGELSSDKPYQTQRDEFINLLKDINPKYINASISIISKEGLKYSLKGIIPKTILKSGEQIEQGQVLGYMGFAYHKISAPCIILNVSKNQKSVDPLSVFGLESKFVDNNFEDYSTKKHSPEKIAEALEIVKESLEEGHPGLYDYASKSMIDSILNSIKTKIDIPMTSEELRFLLTPLLVAIGDNHLAIHGQGNRQMPPFPPVMFGLENGVVKTFVAFKDYQKYLNKEILEINRKPSNLVVKKLKQHITGSDGYIQSLKNDILMLDMTPLYCEIYGVKAGDSIIYKFTDNTFAEFTWKMLGKDDMFYPEFHYKNKKYRYKTSFLSKDIALLEIRTFYLFDTDKDSIENFLDMLEVNKCENLIIDLRGNKGGEGNNLFSMVANKPFQFMIYSKVNQQQYDFFKYTSNYNITESGLFYNYKKSNDGYYSYNNSLSPINDSVHYSGKLYVLTDANSNSESTRFAALVHKYKRGIIIGQETGTTYHQMNAVKFASVSIANTGLTMRMPLVKYVFEKPETSDIPWGRGVIPDYPIDLKFEDYFSDQDRILKFTLDLIENTSSDN